MPRPSGPFEVMRVLPAEDIHSQTYRIKSKTEPFERNAKEYEIVAVDSPAAERGRTGGNGWAPTRCGGRRRPGRFERADGATQRSPGAC